MAVTDKDIKEIEHYWNCFEYCSYLNTALKLKPLVPFLQRLRKHRVLEIGPGRNPITGHYKCREYTEAIARSPLDGLSTLRKMEAKSAVVVSFGVFDAIILEPPGESARIRTTQRAYALELVEEVRRVMYPFGILFGSNAAYYFGDADVRGFEGEEKILGRPYGGVYFSKDEGSTPSLLVSP